ncbi:MAG: hypothetical protein ABIA63_10715, partial [bacterium]
TGRRLSIFLNKARRVAEEARKLSYIERYIPHVCIGLQQIVEFPQTERDKIEKILFSTLSKTRVKDAI